MVFIWRSGGGRRRRGSAGYGGYGPGRAGVRVRPGLRLPPRVRRRGGGSCLRDLLLLDAGCCLAEMIGCGNNLFLVAPSTLRHVHADGPASHGRLADRMIAAIRVYQREISPKRPPVCHFTPSCSAYAVEALERHGARRGAWLTVRRLIRCRPGAARGVDAVPAA